MKAQALGIFLSADLLIGIGALSVGCSVIVHVQSTGGVASGYSIWRLCFAAGLMAGEFLGVLRARKLVQYRTYFLDTFCRRIRRLLVEFLPTGYLMVKSHGVFGWIVTWRAQHLCGFLY